MMKKSKPKKKSRSLKYEKTALKVSPLGLSFPDNFMAIMGWKRVYEK
jgi:hypothetical protein